MRIERLPDRVALVEETPCIEFPFAVPAQVTEPRVTAILSLPGEIKRRDTLGFAGDAGEVGLVGANATRHFDVGQPVSSLGPHEIPALGPPVVVAHHIQHAIELVASRAHIFGRPLEFGQGHRSIDEEFQFRGGKPAQVVLQLPRFIRPLEIGELLRDIIPGARNRGRGNLVVRPESRLPLVVDQSIGQHERAVGRPRGGMRTAQLLQPGDDHRGEIVRFQFAEKFFQKFVVQSQRGQKFLGGPPGHGTRLRRVIIRQQRLEDVRRHGGHIDFIRRRGQRTPAAIGGQGHARRNDQQGVFLLGILQDTPPQPRAQNLRLRCSE